MENVRLQGFKTFLTEHFTALAVEVFGEVESMMEACYEENKRLRSMLDMVLGPEINLHRIDVSLYKGTTTITRRQPLEPNPTSGLETSEPLCKRPKEEMIECEINLETEQQQWPGDVENFNIAMSIKDDPEEEEAGKATCITEAYREVTDQHSDSSATTSAYDNGSEREAWSVPEANEAARASLQVLNQDSMNVNQQTNPETTSTDPGAVTKKKKTGAATYNSKFNPKWEEEWSCITAGSTPFHFWCTVCRRELECRHSGRADVVRHFKRDYHIKKLQFYEKLFGSSLKLKMAVIPKTGEVDKLEAQTRRAEVKVAVTLVQHDIPLAFSDHLSPLFKHCFPDSRIASKYSSARTKTTAIINKCVAPYLMNEMARNLTKQPFSLAIEGSNNIGKEKMKPLTVKLWSPKGVVKNFLNMGVTAGASTPDSICRKINEALQSYFIPWTNCIALSVNDTKVDLASEKFRKIILLDQNPAVYVLGWPCHIVHDNARASSLMYYQESRFDVEDMCADLGLWFKSNTNHPDDFRVFCDTQYMELLQNVNIRWLRLELAVNHIMRLYKHLKTYFKSTDETQGRGVRLRMRFQDPMTEVHLLFYQALLPAFVEFNQIFQRQDPCVHLLHGQIRNFISMLMLKFLKPETFNETSPEKVGYKDEENQLSDSDLDPGLTTKAALTRLNETEETRLPIGRRSLLCPKKSKFSQQKTMLQIPRIMLNKSFSVSRVDQQFFLERLSDAFRDFPEDQKPLITKINFKLDEEWTECALGQVPKGSPLSYQFPLPSSQDFKPNDDAPSQPLLPLTCHALEPVSVFPTLSANEQAFVNAMNVTWKEAHDLEQSTRGSKEAADKLLKMRLTSRFRDICNLKPGRSHADHLLYKIQNGDSRCKTAQIDKEMKPEALREYCRNLCINWSPCGLVVHPSAPWLGAIPDGLVYDPKEINSFGLVHTKFVMFKSFIECQFLTFRNGVLQLKKAHRHYWHMQGEMMVTGTSWCDLVVCSNEDILVQRIYRDEDIIKFMKRKLEEFFFYYYLPNLI
ncbi:uncharacterized protein LOC124856284 isoform X3 [Girardinichthys multiradiatus]|uniref:uncharacterized protein LOC124856284 isoform X3 n=1 Tax=Girardinichthys multiradiatus TaxID=208333 RepID=UPI001FAE27C4|nr:uncharacterized protein LOC124856284 isoform X3 [Girardinichthys multiradiatus]